MVENLTLDRAARTVTLAGRPLDLTDIEFTVLEVLMQSPGKVVNRQVLAEEALGRKFSPFDHSLDMHLSRLRKKLAGEGASEHRVNTVRGIGYQFILKRISTEKS